MASRGQARRHDHRGRPAGDLITAGAAVTVAAGTLIAYLAGVLPIQAAALGLLIAAMIVTLRGRRSVPDAFTGTLAPRQIRLATYGPLLGLAALGLLLAALWIRTENRPVQATAATVTSSSGPSGFAELCVGLWLEHGVSFIPACQPGVAPDTLTESGDLRALHLAAYSSTQTSPGYWTVLVAVRLQALAANGKTWKGMGVNYYRTSVYEHDGRLVMRGLPRQVAAPVPDESTVEQPPALDASLGPAQAEDPKTTAITEYLRRYLIAPPTDDPGKGDVANYLLPTAEPPLTVHSPLIRGVRVTHTAYEPVDGDPDPSNPTRVNALAQVSVVYGTRDRKVLERAVQQVPFVLQRQGASQWLIASIPPVPPLKEESP